MSLGPVNDDEAFTASQLIGPLTSLQPSKRPVSEALLTRRLRSLSEPARAALARTLVHEASRRGAKPLGEALQQGVVRALVEYPEATAREVARVHRLGTVMTDSQRNLLRSQHQELSRLARETVQVCVEEKTHIHPAANDRWCVAQTALLHTSVSDAQVGELLFGPAAAEGMPIRRSGGRSPVAVTTHGVVVGARIAIQVAMQYPTARLVTCQNCHQPIDHAEIMVCRGCCAHVFCPTCSRNDAVRASHGPECDRQWEIVCRDVNVLRRELEMWDVHVAVLEVARGVVIPVHIGAADYASHGPNSVVARLLSASPDAAATVVVYDRAVSLALSESLSDERQRALPANVNMNELASLDSICSRVAATYPGVVRRLTPPSSSQEGKEEAAPVEKEPRCSKRALKRRRAAAARCIQRRWRQRDCEGDEAVPPEELASCCNATSNAEDGDSSCVVCLERPRCVVVLPCRHLSLCEACASGLASCPMCRGEVRDSLVVFV